MAKLIIDGIEINKIAVVVEGYTGNTSGDTPTITENWFEFEWDTTQIEQIQFRLNNQEFTYYESPVRVNVSELLNGETLTQFGFMRWHSQNQYITKIVQLPDLSTVTDLEGAFMQLTGLTDKTIDLSNQNLSNVTTFQDCFMDFAVFKGDGFTFDFTNTILPDLDKVNTFQMFAETKSYNQSVNKVIMNGQTLEDTKKMEQLFVAEYNAHSNNIVINTGFTPSEKTYEESEPVTTVMCNNYTLAARDEWRKCTGMYSEWERTTYFPWGNVGYTTYMTSQSPNDVTHTYIYDETATDRREVTVNVKFALYTGSFTYTQVAEGEEVPQITWHQLTWDTPKDQPIRILKVKPNVYPEAEYSYYAAFYPHPVSNNEGINAQWYSVSTKAGDWYDDHKSFQLNQSVEEEILVFSQNVYWTGQEENAPLDAIQYGIIE